MIYLSIVIIILLAVVIAMQFIIISKKTDTLDHDRIKEGFNSVAMDVLSKQRDLGSQELDKKKELIEQELTGKKQLIDQRLDMVNIELAKVRDAVQKFSSASGEKMEGVTGRLEHAAQVIIDLRNTTGRLNEILGSSQKRGEWGQRMAKDILNLAGLKEGLNYTEQESTEAGRPDFTFLLPEGLKVNMDCKFPLSNYMVYVQAASPAEKDSALKKFLSDARGRLKETGKRDYINPEAGTLDYAIMFISNEQVFNFINENDPAFIDDAMKIKVIVCSPFSLYAFISVIRQAAENFKMEKSAREILVQLGKFSKQWEEYKTQFTEMGEAIDKVKTAYDTLITTRTRMLEVPLKAVERLREEQNVGAGLGPPNDEAKTK
jgi:DNA recombination protein RmuC